MACVAPGLMPSNDECPFSALCTPLVVRTLVQPLDQRGQVDDKDEHTVKPVDERREVPRTRQKMVIDSSRSVIWASTSTGNVVLVVPVVVRRGTGLLGRPGTPVPYRR